MGFTGAVFPSLARELKLNIRPDNHLISTRTHKGLPARPLRAPLAEQRKTKFFSPAFLYFGRAGSSELEALATSS